MDSRVAQHRMEVSKEIEPVSENCRRVHSETLSPPPQPLSPAKRVGEGRLGKGSELAPGMNRAEENLRKQ
ncbi:hypothetical protein CA85_47790 [Allorhodopirellula solitaria]|uniref:Uncharacterized protein n=1 Tax=Allorhodopirellula solitaria TaxID=2527987 RepID=A0A5C5X0R7_9BACT|nr:hypothetical protein CA85_47790 [Allorhodopirellula solitaria]